MIYAIMEGDQPRKPEGVEDLGFTKGLWRIVERCWLIDASERADVVTAMGVNSLLGFQGDSVRVQGGKRNDGGSFWAEGRM